MRPVFQRNLRGPAAGDDPPAGDCMAACLATILELELAQVPNFGDDRTLEVAAELDAHGAHGWWVAMRRWLRAGSPTIGPLDIAAIGSLADVIELSPGALALAVIPSPRGGHTHVVVADAHGFVVHDPYPGPTGCTGAHVGRLGCTEVWVLTLPYDPFPDELEAADAG